MTKFQKASLRVWLLIAALLLAPIHVLAGDSTSFTRSTVTAVAPSGGAVPVGTVIIWPFTSNPVGWSEGKWLECNGQSITSSAHPELYALGYTAVPAFCGRNTETALSSEYKCITGSIGMHCPCNSKIKYYSAF